VTALSETQPFCIDGADPHRPVGVPSPPGRVSEDIIGGERPALTRGQDQRVPLRQSGGVLASETLEQLEKLGNRDRETAVRAFT
jgi:hypothetical protein